MQTLALHLRCFVCYIVYDDLRCIMYQALSLLHKFVQKELIGQFICWSKCNGVYLSEICIIDRSDDKCNS